MAHFRGTLQGTRGEASRLGTAKSGLSVTAASWEGRVEVSLHFNETAGKDYARISLAPHHGAGVHRELFYGPVSGE